MSERGKKGSPVTVISAERRKRINRLKKIIIGSIVCAILIPIILCVILLIKVGRMEAKIAELEETQAIQIEQAIRNKGYDTVGEYGDGENITAEGTGMDKDSGTGKTEANSAEAVETVSAEITDMEDASTEPEEDHVRRVYLTFDDGPSGYTDDILDILDSYGVKATFFVVGKTDSHSIEMYQQIVERGHTLGMHSYSHNYQELYESVDSFSEDLLMIRDYLYGITGVVSNVYRFPGGSSNTVSQTDMQELIRVLQEEGIAYFDWNVSCGDGGSRLLTVDELVENTMINIEDYQNVVILMHDSVEKSTTVEALPIIIERILALPDTEILPIGEDTFLVQHVRAE